MEILFSKAFRKLLNEKGDDVVSSAVLIAVIKISDKSQLSNSFIDYDTDMDYVIEENRPLLMLLFLKPSKSNSKNVFITIRNWTEEKEMLYQNQIGKDFNVVIESK